ncbi:hypothetical protein PR003_g4995 [Phytophthora rubi]|uniref:Uncharacterized protein n=2 Tax=Phytophthora rubi TaxID=129364 RepID=A0A6A3NPL3_9STRA|nr:hypothetical protein PR001_g4246 [Phytophthora rubi]KAE9351221.1 hypothetical protein PR003_g4995 [Phytophthora rubi]
MMLLMYDAGTGASAGAGGAGTGAGADGGDGAGTGAGADGGDSAGADAEAGGGGLRAGVGGEADAGAGETHKAAQIVSIGIPCLCPFSPSVKRASAMRPMQLLRRESAQVELVVQEIGGGGLGADAGTILDLTALAGAPSLVVLLARDLVAASPLTQDHWGDCVAMRD